LSDYREFAAIRLMQAELEFKAGVVLRFIRDLGQDKRTLRLDKVNQLLYLFGYKVGDIPIDRDLFKVTLVISLPFWR